MNYSIAVLLLNTNIQLVACSYEPSASKDIAPITTLFKTFNKNLKEGDLVLVSTNTRHGFTVVRVEKTGVQLDPHTSCKIDWVVETFDTAGYQKILELENAAIEKMKAKEADKRAAELRKTMGLDDEDMANLEISKTIDGVAVLAAPKKETAA